MPSSVSNASLREQLIPTTQHYQSKIPANIRDSILMKGNIMVSAGNYLLYRNGVLPLVPASCFIAEGVINAIISGTNLVLRRYDIQKQSIDTSLTLLSFATAGFLPYAVFWLNWPTPNPEMLPVTYCFAKAAVTSTLNHLITIGKKIAKGCTTNNADNAENITNQQANIWQKLGNTGTSLLAPITIASALAGVSLFASHELSNPNNNDDDKSFFDKKSTAFYDTIAGLTTVGVVLLVNTGIELYENWCANRSNEFDVENSISISSSASSSTTSLSSNDSDESSRLLKDQHNTKTIAVSPPVVAGVPLVKDEHNPKIENPQSSAPLADVPNESEPFDKIGISNLDTGLPRQRPVAVRRLSY